MEEKKFCKFCGEEIDKSSIVCPKCGRQLKLINNNEKKQNTNTNTNKNKIEKQTKFYEQEWFMWIMLVVFAPVGIFFMWKFNNKLDQKKKFIISFVFGIIFLIVFFVNNGDNEEYEKIVWENISMHEVLPEPTGKKGDILTNSDENLSVYIQKQSEEDYKDYIEECKKKGFTIDSENDTSSYEAYNKAGYKLRVYYSEYSKEYHIDLESPLEVKENAWTESTLSKKLPKPKSTKGKVESDSSNYYTFYAADMSLEDFEDYVEDLKEEGFDVNHYKTDESYSAQNKDGYKVSISYEGFNTIKISISKPEEDTDEEDVDEEQTTTEKEDKNSNSTSNELSNDFKKAMDDYENFIDEYISFMKKYNNSTGTDLSLLKDYTEYLQKYSDMLSSFEKWEDEDLNDKETKYYLEVQTRISKKLLEASLN